MVNHFTKGNKSAFARAVGISNQSLGEIVGARQGAPSFSALQKIALAYPDISLHWLVLGEEPMFSLTDDNRAHELEQLASEIEDKTEQVLPKEGLSENSLFELRKAEEAERAGLISANEAELEVRRMHYRKDKEGEPLTASDADNLASAKAKQLEAEHIYTLAARNRIRAERALLGYETSSVTAVYKLGHDGEPGSLYEGLLARRLNISNEAAEKLVKSGKIRATYIDGEGYRITEQAVRLFLGEF